MAKEDLASELQALREEIAQLSMDAVKIHSGTLSVTQRIDGILNRLRQMDEDIAERQAENNSK